MRYYEDIPEGETMELGTTSVSREEIKSFAERYDPQPFHVDEDAAAESMYGGLIASGWQTVALCMRVVVDELLSDSASAGARGVDELRWKQPVRPDQPLHVFIEILEKSPAEGRDDIGNLDSRIWAEDDDGEEVVTFVSHAMFGRRAADD